MDQAGDDHERKLHKLVSNALSSSASSGFDGC
jgi:hypothetical protein